MCKRLAPRSARCATPLDGQSPQLLAVTECTGSAPFALEHPWEIVIFELTRLDLQAAAVVQWACEWALRPGAGTPFTLSSDEASSRK